MEQAQRFRVMGQITALVLIVGMPRQGISGDTGEPSLTAVVGQAVRCGETPPLSSLTRPLQTSQTAVGISVEEIPRHSLPHARTTLRALSVADPVVQLTQPKLSMQAPRISFDGLSNLDGVAPPDSNGDVGPNHYVEMVNIHLCVYDKVTGTNLIAPIKMSQLFAAGGFGAPAATLDNGDPIVLYDHLADRWFISQFIVNVNPCHEVIAISKTGDPTGAWWLYDFTMPNTKMNDYPHFGVWPDGYYMTDNQFNPDNSWGGAGVFVFNRAKMLVGDPTASYQYFDLYGVDQNYGGMLPADLDGAPPPSGTPNYFAMVDDSYLNLFDAMYFWEFHVDWTTPANSTFGRGGKPNYTNAVAAFDSDLLGGSRDVIPQPGTSQKLDPIADRLMHRLQYRNFGGYESLVVCHTVDAGADHAGVRYYQFRRPLPGGTFAIAEQATFAPDADHRWMGSAAMDGFGNLAVGYSVSGNSTYPSLRYAGRMANDPSNGLYQGEATLFAGSASQTGVNRWGDYSALSVDPTDDCTFWYVNEYSTGGWNWRTRIGSFRMGSPLTGVLRGAITNAVTGQPVPDARVYATNSFYSAMTDTHGAYVMSLATGDYWMVVSAHNYITSTPVQVTLSLGATTLQNFALSPLPFQVQPETGYNATGFEGGPFTPLSATYTVSNASLSALTWTAACPVAWLDLSSSGGLLAPGASTAVTAAINHQADFLAPMIYISDVTFSNVTGGSMWVRPVSLTVTAAGLNDFNAGLPVGWTVIDTAGTGATWRFDDPGSRGNLTGGSAGFAIVDSDYEGNVNIDTELRTPAFNYAWTAAVTVQFKTDFYYYEAETADVDISTNGAAGPWSNLWRRTGVDVNGPTTIDLDVSAQAAGQTNVMFRFHYWNAFYEWWWQVDEVSITTPRGATGTPGIHPEGGLETSGYYGGPFAPDRLYRLTNSSPSSLTWTGLCSAAWVTLAPQGSVLNVGATVDVTVQANVAANTLMPGTYNDSLVFSNLTGGTTQNRAVTVTVLEPLAVSPVGAFVSSGLEGGPFSPANQTYALSNLSSHAMTWTSRWSQAWLNVTPCGGTVSATSAGEATLTLNTNGLTAPGRYADTVLFSNQVTGATLSRAVTVTVAVITGDIRVFDSIASTNDLALPFGGVSASAPRIEHLTLANVHASRNLTVNNIFFGYYIEHFNAGTAIGWHPIPACDWMVVNGEYRAETNGTAFMTSVYTAQAWSDCSVQASLRHEGDNENSAGVVLRASANFSTTSVGQGYLFLISSNYYSVFWADGASVVALQGWSVSPRILVGTATNVVVASAQGSQLRFYINGSLVWTGEDSRSTSGMIGFMGYTETGVQTTHYFDNLIVDKPRVTGLNPGGKQCYLNGLQQPKSRLEGSDAVSASAPASGIADADDVPAGTPYPAGSASTWGPFAINNLPTLPAVLAPGSTVAFDVVYTPTTLGSNQTIVAIASDDNDTSQVDVSVDGRASAGVLTGRVTGAWSGAGLTGVTITASDVGTNWVTTTDTFGSYRLDLLSGLYGVTAEAPRYVMAGTTGVGVSDLGITTQDFALVGLVTITATALPHGSIAPSGNVVVALGGSTNFVVTADTYYSVGSVLTNGEAVADAHGMATTQVLWQNIAQAGSILAGFSENVAPRGAPEWWLALYGLTNGTPTQSEQADSDQDGSLAWQEYWAGTDPTNTHSVLKVTAFNVSNGAVRLAWLSTTNGYGYPYRIQRSTDLLVTAWGDASTNLARQPPTNDCWLTVPITNGAHYYRVVVTTNAP